MKTCKSIESRWSRYNGKMKSNSKINDGESMAEGVV